MSYQNACTYSMEDFPPHPDPNVPWYCKCIRPCVSIFISILLALSVSHLSEKYSTNNALQLMKSDMSSLRSSLNVLTEEVRTLTDSRDEFKNKLKEVLCIIPKLSDAVSQLKHEISEDIEDNRQQLLAAISPDNIKKVVKTELTIYDADKTGKTDYALESSGGMILSTRDTEAYPLGEPTVKMFGLPICKQLHTPRMIIQAKHVKMEHVGNVGIYQILPKPGKDRQHLAKLSVDSNLTRSAKFDKAWQHHVDKVGAVPGECWSFKGSQGVVVIQLLGYVLISGVSIEHIPLSLSPTENNNSAPKDFSVWVLDNIDDNNAFKLGSYTYDVYGSSVQYFQAENDPHKSYKIVEVKIHSNHGHNNYTCVYRVRVHGTLTSYQEIG